MSPDNNPDRSVQKTGMNLAAGFYSCRSGKKHNFNSRWLEVSGDICKMLFCKYFRWSHYACLITVSDGDKGRKYRNHCLAAAYVSLEEPVHLTPAFHIFPNLPDNPLLRTCQLVRKGVIAEIEGLSDTVHLDSRLDS